MTVYLDSANQEIKSWLYVLEDGRQGKGPLVLVSVDRGQISYTTNSSPHAVGFTPRVANQLRPLTEQEIRENIEIQTWLGTAHMHDKGLAELARQFQNGQRRTKLT